LLLVSPWLIGFAFLQALPALASVGVAFTDWQPPAPPQWVGLANFQKLLTDAHFAHALYNTAVYAFWTVVPGLAVGLAIALVLRGRGRFTAGLRAAVFMPAVVAGVATALMWGWIFNPRSGMVNGLLAAFGIAGPTWLDDATWAMPAIVAIGLWNIGVNVVVYVAALGGVSREIEDAAALDGAGHVARLRHVIWPALTPVTFYLAVVNTVTAFQVFTPSYLLTGGGPQDATLTTSLYTYQVAFASGQLGYGAALTCVVIALVLAIAFIYFRYAGGRVLYGAAQG